MTKKIKDIILLIIAISGLLFPIFKLYIDYRLEIALNPIKADIQEIKLNYKFWLKEISKNYIEED